MHSTPLKEKHICYRVAECIEKSVAYLYRLCCINGVISEMIPGNNLTVLTSKHHIPLENWRTNTTITMKAAQSDPRNVEKCDCEQHKETIDLKDLTQILKPRSSRGQKNSLYTLHESDHEKIASPSGWLEDNIIDASQAQHFPLTHGLEPPTLEQMDGFQAHTNEFLQIILITLLAETVYPL